MRDWCRRFYNEVLQRYSEYCSNKTRGGSNHRREKEKGITSLRRILYTQPTTRMMSPSKFCSCLLLEKAAYCSAQQYMGPMIAFSSFSALTPIRSQESIRLKSLFQKDLHRFMIRLLLCLQAILLRPEGMCSPRARQTLAVLNETWL